MLENLQALFDQRRNLLDRIENPLVINSRLNTDDIDFEIYLVLQEAVAQNAVETKNLRIQLRQQELEETSDLTNVTFI